MTFDAIDIILYVIYLVFAVSLVAIVWSNVRHMMKGDHTEKRINLVPVRKITISVLLTLFASVMVSLIFASSKPVKVAGELYKDVLWLRVADVCIITLVIMLIVGILAVLFSFIKPRLK